MPRSTQNQVIERNDESLGIVVGLGTSGVNPTLKQGIILSDGGGALADCFNAILLCPDGPTLCNSAAGAQLTGSIIIGHEACKSAEVAVELINNVIIGPGALDSVMLQGGVMRDVVMIGHNCGRTATQVAKNLQWSGPMQGTQFHRLMSLTAYRKGSHCLVIKPDNFPPPHKHWVIMPRYLVQPAAIHHQVPI
jgi:hypothetical protein